MADTPEAIRALESALAVSPDNVPLRRHLAETLLSHGRAADAEREFQEAIRRAPTDVEGKLGLARAFMAQNKSSHAIVVLEELMKLAGGPGPGPRARLLYARALAREGKHQQASHQYREAIDEDPSLEDTSLAEELGVGEASFDDDERVSPLGVLPADVERPRASFADVGGMDRVKEEIRLKIIHPLAHPEVYRAYGKKVGGGILLYGPPGCGKTHLARATAGEVSARFICVGIADVLNMYIGQSEANLRAIFEQARAHTPCVLFFDEVDALGASRSDMRHSAGRQIINQFLSELDGVGADNEGLLVLAATNAPWHVDPAFRRPGRFDRIIFVPPPDAPAREQIVRIMVRDKPTDGVDAAAIARKTDGFSGADLKALIDVAVEEKLGEAMAAGAPVPLSSRDLLRAARQVKPSTREWFSAAKNHALYSNEGGLYDDVLDYLKLR